MGGDQALNQIGTVTETLEANLLSFLWATPKARPFFVSKNGSRFARSGQLRRSEGEGTTILRPLTTGLANDRSDEGIQSLNLWL
jgi:hypothetical protein